MGLNYYWTINIDKRLSGNVCDGLQFTATVKADSNRLSNIVATRNALVRVQVQERVGTAPVDNAPHRLPR